MKISDSRAEKERVRLTVPPEIGGSICGRVRPIVGFNATARIYVSTTLGFEIEMLVEDARWLHKVLGDAVAEWDVTHLVRADTPAEAMI